MPVFFTDTSYFQAGVDDSYTRPWISFRACDGTFRDPKFAHNLMWAKRKATGRRAQLVGFTVYAVYRPGVDIVSIVQSMVGTPHPKMTVMIDVESWNGQIGGDHSAEITTLAERFAHWLGDKRRVLVYANKWDFLGIYPNRPAWLHTVVAGYTSTQPDYPGDAIGWQYTDGQAISAVPAGWPHRTDPFGACDHNVFPNYTKQQLAAALGLDGSPPEDDDPLSNLTKEQLTAIADAVWSHTATPAGTKMPRRMDVAVANSLQHSYDAAAAGKQIASQLGALARVLTTSGSGVLARVASLQAAVAKLPQMTNLEHVAEITAEPVSTTVQLDPATITALATTLATSVVDSLKAFVRKAGQ